MKHWDPAVESYAALFLVCVGVLPTIALARADMLFLMGQVFPAVIFAWLFAISGVRRAKGAARLVAITSMTVLVFHAILLVVLASLIRERV